NSIRIKNVPPSGSLEYWLDSIIFAFRSYKKCDIAETIPGLSEHFTINLPMLSLLKLFVDSISIVQNSYYNLINIHYTQIFFVVRKKNYLPAILTPTGLSTFKTSIVPLCASITS